ncbi:MAG: Fic family protein [Flavobacteriales bacterium]|nr:Fic family protein [Flavobacteriales bacterium]
MNKAFEFHTDPSSMEPLFPSDNGELEALSLELTESIARLSGSMNLTTRRAIAELLRPMNSYYSNLIEGHDTHPIDINRALNNDYSGDPTKRDRQHEAQAHIEVHRSIFEEIKDVSNPVIPSSVDFLKRMHRDFYSHLSEEMKTVRSKDGSERKVIPGELRDCEVEVGKHVAPSHESFPRFMDRFEVFYDPTSTANSSKLKRIISIAASHHRLAWIHPFVDGNGRVVRLFSDASFMYDNLDADGLWSISRGLARTHDEYYSMLANADLPRMGNHDGRGNLSNAMLVDFCKYFLRTAIDQTKFMYAALDTDNILTRLNTFCDAMVARGKFKTEMRYILIDVFLKGKISKPDAMRITNTSDKTLKNMTDALTEMGLITPKKESILMMYYAAYPILISPWLFPGLYPTSKESDMMELGI